MAGRKRYRVVFHNQGKVYEIFVKAVSSAEIFGFVALEGIVFGEKSQVVVDPSEESLKNEFRDVERCLVPLHAVIRIDEVSCEGVSRIVPGGKEGAVAPFPAPIYTPPPKGK
ncbi:MAG: DUF1820 family protein [Acidobacteriota bacterium]|nr:DUF1820 family protein [Acidobacteriota bacterium]MDQ7086672.1 DUF1820 family protein [Acidobacteriota bacterium]